MAGAGRPADDVLNDVFQLLFETDRPYVAVVAALRAHLQDFRGVLLVDDATPARDALALVLSPLIAKFVAASGDALLTEFRRRFDG